MRYNQKRTRKSSKRTQLWVFTPHFSKFRAFRMLHPAPKRHVFLEFLLEKKAFHFSKRALNAGTAHSKWLKYTLLSSSYLLKVTKCLSKISQFEFLVVTEKNVFAYKLFLLLNISGFIFYVKFANPSPEKSHPPSFPATLL